LVWCTLRIFDEKQTNLAAELRFYRDTDLRMREVLEDVAYVGSSGASANIRKK